MRISVERLIHECIRYRTISSQTELYDQCSGCRSSDKPGRTRRTKDRRVELAVPVVVSRCRQVGSGSKGECKERKVFASDDEPLTSRFFPDREIGLAVSRVVAFNGTIAIRAALHCQQAGSASQYPPFRKV